MVPQIGDTDNATVELLKIIAQNTGGLGDLTVEEGDEISVFDGPGVTGSVGVLNPSQYRIYETDDMPASNDDGTLTLNPGDSAPLVSYRANSPEGVALLALGASDEVDVQYGLVLDNDLPVGGRTNSPLGLLNDPFSFVDQLHAVIPARQTVEYWAYLDSGASGPVDLVARLHLEEL